MGQQSRSSKKQSKAEKSAKMAAARERVAAQREAERKAQRRRSILIGAGATVAAAAVVAGLVTIVVTNDDGGSGGGVVADVRLDAGKTSPIQGVTAYTASQGHIANGTKITYKQNPPLGGQHDPAWLNCGVYTEAVPNRNAVHSLEHGAVWITYRPDLPADQVAKLTTLVQGKTYMLLSPYPGMENPVTASAWGLQLKLDSPDDPRLTQFIDTYREGDQTPEPGAACTGGVGKPAA
jgi:hypothetical protein